MSIHDFYSSLMSGERTPLFQALYKLSRLQALQMATKAESPDEQMGDWSIWNAPGTVVGPTDSSHSGDERELCDG